MIVDTDDLMTKTEVRELLKTDNSFIQRYNDALGYIQICERTFFSRAKVAAFAASRPKGLTLNEVAFIFGCSRQNIEQLDDVFQPAYYTTGSRQKFRRYDESKVHEVYAVWLARKMKNCTHAGPRSVGACSRCVRREVDRSISTKNQPKQVTKVRSRSASHAAERTDRIKQSEVQKIDNRKSN